MHIESSLFFFYPFKAQLDFNLVTVFCFLTGCEQMPHGGIDRPIYISFKDDCPANCSCFPIVSLCGFTLTIPLHLSSTTFEEVFTEAIKCSVVFGRV